MDVQICSLSCQHLECSVQFGFAFLGFCNMNGCGRSEYPVQTKELKKVKGDLVRNSLYPPFVSPFVSWEQETSIAHCV
ncbi:hypothetical protein L1887_40023 [Cichorium endivia]|nr:hypothetical protein L1887_40023 [Cichorium endivia]